MEKNIFLGQNYLLFGPIQLIKALKKISKTIQKGDHPHLKLLNRSSFQLEDQF